MMCIMPKDQLQYVVAGLFCYKIHTVCLRLLVRKRQNRDKRVPIL